MTSRSETTRLPNYIDRTASAPKPPAEAWRVARAVEAEVTLHDSDGAEYRCKVLCGSPEDIVPAAERMVEDRDLDLGVSDWAAA